MSLRTIVVPHGISPVATVFAHVPVGSIDETADEQGICHFIEHMLFKGSENFEGREIGSLIESFGGDSNAYTTFDRTVYYLKTPADSLRQSISLMLDALFCSLFRKEDIEAEREVIHEEMRRGDDDPWP